MSVVAKRYADALLAAAQAQQLVTEVAEDLSQVTKALTAGPEIWSWLQSPSVPLPQKQETCRVALADAQPLVRNLVLLMLERHRERELPAVLRAFHASVLALKGEVEAVVMSPTPLSEGQRQALREVFEGRLDAKLRVQWVVDSNLLGGVVVRVGDRLYDGSLRTQLARFAHVASQSRIGLTAGAGGRR